MNEVSPALAAYIEFFEQLSPDSLQRINRVFSADARFKDPFNDVTGTAAIERVFAHMFRNTAEPHFEVTDAMESGHSAFLRWNFSCRIRGHALRVTGVSHLRLATDGRVEEHIDYWDPVTGFYDRLPLVGILLRWLHRRMAA